MPTNAIALRGEHVIGCPGYAADNQATDSGAYHKRQWVNASAAGVSIVDKITFSVGVAIAGHEAPRHAFDEIAAEEAAEAGVVVAGAEVDEAVGVGLLDLELN
jgi:hypothetical protein